MGDRRLLHFGHLASMAVMIRFVILWIFAASAVAQELSIPIGEIKDDEVRLVQICNEMKEALREFYPAVDAIEDANEQEKYFRERDPSLVYVQKLVDFEKLHRRTQAGLMAVRRLVLLADLGERIHVSRESGSRTPSSVGY